MEKFVTDDEAVVNEWFNALAAGDLDRMMAVAGPDTVVHEAENLPYAGDIVGVDGIRTDLLGKMSAVSDLAVTETSVAQAGDRVLVQMTGEFTSKATGRTVAMPMIEIYTVRDGKIRDIDVFYKDTAKINVLFNER